MSSTLKNKIIMIIINQPLYKEIHTKSKRPKMEDNLENAVLYSFEKIKQNRDACYQQNGGFEEKGSQTASLYFNNNIFFISSNSPALSL